MSALEPLVAVVRVTERCNLSCGFCAYDRSLPLRRASADPAQVMALGRALAEQASRSGRRALVSFLGGEPLLWPALAEVEGALLELGLELSLTTNGTALSSARVRRRLLERYSELTVSVDGLPETHDRLRGWPGGFAALERDVGRLSAERRGRRPLLRVNTVLMADNVGELAELCRRLAGFGVDEITFNQLGGRDRPEFHALHRLTPGHVEDLAALLPELRRELAGQGVLLRGGADYLARFAASARRQRLPIADCAPGQSFLFASESGRVAPCSFSLEELGVAPDELEGHDFGMARRARRPGACDDCPSTQVFSKFAE